MNILCIHSESNDFWFGNFMEYFFLPFFVAATSYYLFGRIDENKKRKKYSILGVELLSTFVEEVDAGLKSIKETLNPESIKTPILLPRKSWHGINTISDEILLRIFEVSKGLPDKGFPAQQIRIHLKNYFEHMVTNWDQVAKSKGMYKQVAQGFSSYEESATKVLEMLVHIRFLLEENAKKKFPK